VPRSAPRCVPGGAVQVGPGPVDRALPGHKHHVIAQAHGTPPAVPLTGGNRNDITQLIPLPKAIWAVRDGCRGKPTQPSQRLDPDRGYDHNTHHPLRTSPRQ
jgi:hypothetical protein